MPNQMMLKKVRLDSFPALFTAQDYQGDKKYAYSAKVILPNDDPQQKAVNGMIAAVIKEKIPDAKKAAAFFERCKGDKRAYCLRNGDTMDMDRYHDAWVLTAKRRASDGKPRVVDQDGKTVLVETDGKPYAGCLINALVEFYITTKGNEGIRCGLIGVQFVEDGDSFGGASNAGEDAFAPVEGADAEDLT